MKYFKQGSIKYLFIGFLLTSLSCFELDFALTKNKIEIDDNIEGLWGLEDEETSFRLEKADKYLVLAQGEGEESEVRFTSHKIGQENFWSVNFIEEGVRRFITVKVEIIDENNIIIFDSRFIENSDYKDFQNIPESLKETVFELYLEQEKIEFFESTRLIRK